MTWQRRRNGRFALFYPTHTTIDARGNEVTEPDGDPIRVRFTEMFERSNRAELAGEQEVSLVKILVPHTLDTPLGMRVRIEDDGSWWDVYAPAAYRHGTRHVRHKSVTLRQRPDGGGI